MRSTEQRLTEQADGVQQGSAASDLALVRRVQQGDRSAFDLLVVKYQHKILKLIMRYVRDSSEAMDVAQEAFLKAESAEMSSLAADLEAKLRAARQLAPAEGDAATLAQALRDIIEPFDYLERNLPEGYRLDGQAALQQINSREFYTRIAREALAAAANKPQPKGATIPAGWTVRDRSDLELGAIDIEGPGHPRMNLTTNHGNPAWRTLHALGKALLQAPAPAQQDGEQKAQDAAFSWHYNAEPDVRDDRLWFDHGWKDGVAWARTSAPAVAHVPGLPPLPEPTDFNYEVRWGYTASQMHAYAREASVAAHAASAPASWNLMPAEPTPEMRKAGYGALEKSDWPPAMSLDAVYKAWIAAAPAALTADDLELCRQWFCSVHDLNEGHLERADFVLAEKIYRALGMRVPGSVADPLRTFDVPVQPTGGA